MEIADALTRAVRDARMTSTQVAVAASVTEAAARRWIKGEAVPTGDKLMTLRRSIPGFADLLDSPPVVPHG